MSEEKLSDFFLLQELLAEEKLSGAPILVFANKQVTWNFDLSSYFYDPCILLKYKLDFYGYQKEFVLFSIM